MGHKVAEVDFRNTYEIVDSEEEQEDEVAVQDVIDSDSESDVEEEPKGVEDLNDTDELKEQPRDVEELEEEGELKVDTPAPVETADHLEESNEVVEPIEDQTKPADDVEEKPAEKGVKRQRPDGALTSKERSTKRLLQDLANDRPALLPWQHGYVADPKMLRNLPSQWLQVYGLPTSISPELVYKLFWQVGPVMYAERDRSEAPTHHDLCCFRVYYGNSNYETEAIKRWNKLQYGRRHLTIRRMTKAQMDRFAQMRATKKEAAQQVNKEKKIEERRARFQKEAMEQARKEAEAYAGTKEDDSGSESDAPEEISNTIAAPAAPVKAHTVVAREATRVQFEDSDSDSD